MVEDRLTDGRRIAQLLASEIDGRTDDELASCTVTNADPDVEPTVAGARAYEITADGQRLATVFVHPDRAHVAFTDSHEVVLEAADTRGLRVRPKATQPPQTLVFVESGAEVKRAVAVVQAACRNDESS